jgi:hypothetical protein
VPSLVLFAVLCVTLALVMGELMKREWKIDAITLGTLGGMFLVSAIGMAAYSAVSQQNYLQAISGHIHALVEQLAASASTSNWIGDTDIEEWKRGLIVEFPSAIAIFCLVVVWSNLLLILRLNPEGVRDRLKLQPDFFRAGRRPSGWSGRRWLAGSS